METKFLHSTHINHFLSLPSSSSLSLSIPPFNFNLRNCNGSGEVQLQRGPKKAECMRTLHPSLPVNGRVQVGPTHKQRRRALLFVGLSIFPFLALRGDNAAFRVFASTNGNEHDNVKEESKQEVASPDGAPLNPVISLLNSIGIIGSGVLAALYSIARKDKVQADAMIELLISEVEEKEATINSLKINFDAKYLHLQEQQYILLSKFNEENLSLLNRIDSANVTVTALGRDLQGEKRKIGDFQGQIENLEMKLEEARRYKQTLEDEMKEKKSSMTILQENIDKLSSEVSEKDITMNNLSSSLAQKDFELENLNSAYEQTKNELDAITSEIVNLKDELLKSQSELRQRNSVADDLSNRVDSLTNERDGLTEKLDGLEQLYNNLKTSFEDKVAHDAKLLEEMEVEAGQLREKYELAVSEGRELQSVISDLNQDRVDLKKMLDNNNEYVKTLKLEIESTEAALRSSTDEVSDLNKQLDESKRYCLELEAELSKVQAEFHDTSEFLQTSVKAALNTSAGLADELMSVKAELDKTKNEVEMVSNELITMTNDRNAVQNELVEASGKIEAADLVYKEEKEMVASLKKELQALEEQLSEGQEVKKSLELNLKEMAESVDESSKRFWALSRDLEVSNARVSGLLQEKDGLRNALEKEKQVAKEAQYNLETAHNVVMRLGDDRANLEKRAKKLEEDLAFAKGELLRLNVHLSKIADTIESDHVPSQEVEHAVISKPKEDTKSVFDCETEQEVGLAPAVVVNPKEETGSAINGEVEQEVEFAPATITSLNEKAKSAMDNENEEEFEPSVVSSPVTETNPAFKNETEQVEPEETESATNNATEQEAELVISDLEEETKSFTSLQTEQEAELVAVSDPKGETKSDTSHQTEQEVEPIVISNLKEETESATISETAQVAEPAVISNLEGETKSATIRQIEQEVEGAAEKGAKRAVTATSGTTVKRGGRGRKRKETNQ